MNLLDLLGINRKLLESQINKLRSKRDKMKEEINTLKSDIIERKEKIEGLDEVLTLQGKKKNLISDIEVLNGQIESKKKEFETIINEKKHEIVELDDTILLQDYGLYDPVYNFATLEEYKDRLTEIRNEQKQLIRDKKAAVCSTTWTVNNSLRQGQAMTNQNIRQILRCFNDECDVLIDKVRFNNIEAYLDKIEKACNRLNKMNTKNCVYITDEYADLKIEEMQLAYEYAQKKEEEKEKRREEREILREQAAVQKEIDERRKELEKERIHYENHLRQVDDKLQNAKEVEKDYLLEQKNDIENRLNDIAEAMKDVDYREANKRAGYVYVISNIGSFGKDIYKIGMTRRLTPQDRIDELSSASVPFKFDIHAMIFSDDAPALETALHHKFRDKMVNLMNNRKEFFHVTLDEIKEVVKDNYDKAVEFKEEPTAEQYRDTLKTLEKRKEDEEKKENPLSNE